MGIGKEDRYLNYSLIIYVVGAVFLGSLMRSTFGFGDSVVSMPLLALLPIPFSTAVSLVALVGFTVALFSLFSGWKRLDLNVLKRLTLSTIAGIPVGLLLVAFAERTWVDLFLGLLLVLYAGYSLVSASRTNHSIQQTVSRPGYAIPFGFSSGMLGSAYNMNGIPVVLYGTMRNWTPDEFKDNIQAHFLISSILIVLSHFLSGFWTQELGLYYILSLPVIIMAIKLGDIIYSRIQVEKFKTIVLIIILLLGLFMLASLI